MLELIISLILAISTLIGTVWGIVKYYDVFHTMSLEHVADDTIAALLKWEEASSKKEK